MTPDLQEVITRSKEIAALERDLAAARRALTMAEVDLVFAASGATERIDGAKARFLKAAEILERAVQ